MRPEQVKRGVLHQTNSNRTSSVLLGPEHRLNVDLSVDVSADGWWSCCGPSINPGLVQGRNLPSPLSNLNIDSAPNAMLEVNSSEPNLILPEIKLAHYCGGFFFKLSHVCVFFKLVNKSFSPNKPTVGSLARRAPSLPALLARSLGLDTHQCED